MISQTVCGHGVPRHACVTCQSAEAALAASTLAATALQRDTLRADLERLRVLIDRILDQSAYTHDQQSRWRKEAGL